ncbi:MAG: amino acid permease [Gammaproteobacteria bacterium]|nr:amino acid permease [Gammaproteobacteria bacterium]
MNNQARETQYKFGLWTLVALVVGNAVGAGIYTTSGFSLADLGRPEWVILAWVVAGLVALSGALSYGMLSQRLTESGGEYLFLSRSIHPVAGFIAGWISLLAGFPGAIAFAASAFESYLRDALTEVQAMALIAHDSLALAIILLAGLVHMVRVQAGAKLHEYIVVAMVAILIVVIALGGLKAIALTPQINGMVESDSFSLFAFANSLVWISLSYSGFNAAAYVAGEVKKPEVTVMRGMVIGTLATMFLCVALNSIMMFGVPAALTAGQANIATISAQFLGGDIAKRCMELVIAVSLLTSITAMVLAGPRVYAKMAEDGALPRVFAAKAGEPPRAAIVLQVVLAVMLVVISDLRGLLSYLGLTLSLCLALAVSSLFVRHLRMGEKPQSIWYPFAPAVFVTSTVLFATLSAIDQPIKLLAVLPTIGLGVAAYFVSRRMNRV